MKNFGSTTECPMLLQELHEIVNLTVTDNAAKAHDEIFTWLLEHGWHGVKEAPMTYDMDEKTRHGRIDIVVEKGPYRLAVEIDRKTPRKKSVKKLDRFDGHTLLLCRNNDKAGVIQIFQGQPAHSINGMCWLVFFQHRLPSAAASIFFHLIRIANVTKRQSNKLREGGYTAAD